MKICYFIIMAIVFIYTIIHIPDDWELTKRRAFDDDYCDQHKWWPVQEFFSFFAWYIVEAVFFYGSYHLLRSFMW